MNRNGAIIVIEDDIDDKEILAEVFQKLNYSNEIIFFGDGQEALDFLNKTEVIPFLILSDINMPKLDGFGLRTKIRENEQLHTKCIPYLFLTTASTEQIVKDAYSVSVQGFFKKQSSMALIENQVRVIMEYWKMCIAPHDFLTPNTSVDSVKEK